MLQGLLSNLRLFITLVCLSALLALMDQSRVLNIPKSALQGVSTPIQYGLYKTSQAFQKQFEFIILARRASQENKALQEQLAEVISENANLRRQLAETQGFLDQQKSLDPRTYDQVAARPVSLSRYLEIDKGGNDGLKLNQPVVYKDTLIGQIIRVSPKTADVILPTDPDSKIAAFVSDKDGKARGILSGQFGSDMLLDKLLHQEPIKTGDLVYSEGTEGTLPRGLVLGQVASISDQADQVFKNASIKSVFNIGDLDIVFVITN